MKKQEIERMRKLLFAIGISFSCASAALFLFMWLRSLQLGGFAGSLDVYGDWVVFAMLASLGSSVCALFGRGWRRITLLCFGLASIVVWYGVGVLS
jgi:hypothetical protein